MKTTKLHQKKILLEFPTRKELTLHFFRIAEFFESDDDAIRGKKFPIDHFLDTYSDEKGNIDYFSFWEGFNIPMQSFFEFISVHGNDLTDREKEIRDAVVGVIDDDGYIIGIEEGDEAVFRHEEAHELWWANEKYRREAEEIISQISPVVRKEIEKSLTKRHYGREVMLSEINAYLSAWDESDKEDIFPEIDDSLLEETRNKLADVFKKYKTPAVEMGLK
jgi:hypothetical protein